MCWMYAHFPLYILEQICKSNLSLFPADFHNCISIVISAFVSDAAKLLIAYQLALQVIWLFLLFRLGIRTIACRVRLV